MEELKNEDFARILWAKRKSLRMSQRSLGELLSVHENTIKNWESGKPIPSSKMPAVLAFINGQTKEEKAVVKTSDTQGCPYYDVDFMGGFDVMVNNQTNTPDGYINIPAYNSPGLMWCNITGHSMEPMINHGDIIALRELADWHTYLPKGEVYGIVTTNGLRTVKIVRKGSDSEHLRLVPVNTSEYDEEEIPVTAIIRVFQIVGNLKRF